MQLAPLPLFPGYRSFDIKIGKARPRSDDAARGRRSRLFMAAFSFLAACELRVMHVNEALNGAKDSEMQHDQ